MRQIRFSAVVVSMLLWGCGGASPADPSFPGTSPRESSNPTATSGLSRGSGADDSALTLGRHSVIFQYAGQNDLIHGVAGDARLVFVAEPLVQAVVVLDRFTGKEVGRLPAPSVGFALPFTLRTPRPGRLVVLDAGGFPNPFVPSVPRIYDYDYQYDAFRHRFTASISRTVRLDGLPIVFAEDLEVLDDGTYVMSESIIGALWLIHPDSTVTPALFPDNPGVPLPQLGGCPLAPLTIGGVPFAPGFAPGVGTMATRGGQLYFASSCLGGIYRIPVAALSDPTRSPAARATSIVTVSARPDGVIEALEGPSFDRFSPASPWLYVGDPFHLQLLRINVDTGAREVVSSDAQLFNFSIATTFLPPILGVHTLVVSSDQEYRLAQLNPGIPTDMFVPPFLLTKIDSW